MTARIRTSTGGFGRVADPLRINLGSVDSEIALVLIGRLRRQGLADMSDGLPRGRRFLAVADQFESRLRAAEQGAAGGRR